MNKIVILAVLASLLMLGVAYAGPSTEIGFMRLPDDRTIVLQGGVTEALIQPIIESLKVMNRDNINSSSLSDRLRPLYLVLNTNGGSVDAGMRLVHTMRSIASPVYCVVETKAYSMGAVIAAFCTRTYVQKNAMMMFHQASYGVSGPEEFIASQVVAIQKSLANFHKQIAKRIGLSYETYRKKIRAEWWLTADEAVKEGIAYGTVDRFLYEVYPMDQRQTGAFPFFSNEDPLEKVIFPRTYQDDL